MAWNLTSVLLIILLCFVICAWLVYLAYKDAEAERPYDPEAEAFAKDKIKLIASISGDPYKRLAEKFADSASASSLLKGERLVGSSPLLAYPYGVTPVPMVLYCPRCSVQHIDAPEDGEFNEIGWTNPPHRSHLCAECGCIWRPADIATTGVLDIQTKGGKDTWDPEKAREFIRSYGSLDERA